MAQGHVVTITNISAGIVAISGLPGVTLAPGQNRVVTLSTKQLEQSGLQAMATSGLIRYAVADDTNVPAAMQIPTTADIVAGIAHVTTHETGGGDVLTDIPAAATLAGGAITGTATAGHVLSVANPHSVTMGAGQLDFSDKWVMSTGGARWREDADAIQTNGAGLVGDAAEVALGAASVITYDAGSVEWVPFITSATGTDISANGQFASDTKNNNDAVYIGHTVPFPEVSIDIIGAGAGQTYTNNAYTWEYWNGAWTALTLGWDGTDLTANNGLRPFQQNGAISFAPPLDWIVTATPGTSLFWIRARLTNKAGLNVVGNTGGVTFNRVIPEDGFTVPASATINHIRVLNGRAVLHTGAAITFVLHEYTSGTYSDTLTWATGKQQDSFTLAGGLLAATGAQLGIVVVGDDGAPANEPGNVVIEMNVTIA